MLSMKFSGSKWGALQSCGARLQYYGSLDLEPQREAADYSLGRANDEEFVVDRLVGRGIAEEVADADEHFPLRRAEVHKRQRLAHLHVEAAIKRGAIRAGGRGSRPRERAADAIQHDHARRGFRHFGF